MSAADLAKLIAGRDTAPVLVLDQKALDDVGSFGPAAYYYLGSWMASRDEGQPPLPDAGARTRLLYRLGFDRAKGLARREAGLALVHELSSAVYGPSSYPSQKSTMHPSDPNGAPNVLGSTPWTHSA